MNKWANHFKHLSSSLTTYHGAALVWTWLHKTCDVCALTKRWIVGTLSEYTITITFHQPQLPVFLSIGTFSCELQVGSGQDLYFVCLQAPSMPGNSSILVVLMSFLWIHGVTEEACIYMYVWSSVVDSHQRRWVQEVGARKVTWFIQRLKLQSLEGS